MHAVEGQRSHACCDTLEGVVVVAVVVAVAAVALAVVVVQSSCLAL